MSLTILNRKLDAVNEKEKRLRQTYDVRGKNKHQHRYISDLKEDFKEDLILRYGNKPYGLGWHENELAEEEEEAMTQEEEEQKEDENLDNIDNDQVEEEDEENEAENDDIMTAGLMSSNNFRPNSGKVNIFSPQSRPFSASAQRPMTASSAKGLSSNSHAFMFNNRPISAIAAKGAKGGNYDSSDLQFGLVRSLQGTGQGFYKEGHPTLQGSTSNQELTSKMRVNESIFWKNTKKFDISKSTKSFDTKRLLFESQHSNPKLLASSDLKFLREAKIGVTLDGAKLRDPENYEFEDIALKDRQRKTEKTFTDIEETDKLNSSVESDAKLTFNQSLSYIQYLRVDTPTDGTRISGLLSPHDGSINRLRKLNRPFTAHPTMSASTSNQKKTLDIIVEHTAQQSRRLYFSSLSDIRKKTFFLKLHSIEANLENHPNSSKELKLVQWEAFKDVVNKEDFQSLHLIITDLNTFDHVKYELEFQKNGGMRVKDKDGNKVFTDVYKEFVEMTKTNLTSVIIYYETSTNKMLEVFSRIIVYEKQENEYEIQVWRNIYRYILHTLVLANSPLYPEAKNYHDLSRIIKEIIEDRNDYVSTLSKQIQKMKDHPTIIERNGHVYNFDFHSYILECSSFYARVLEQEVQGVEDINTKAKRTKTNTAVSSNKKARPFSAVDSKDKLLSSGSKQIQAFQRSDLSGDSNASLEPLLIPSPNKGNTQTQAVRARPETASVVSRNLSGNLNRIMEEQYDYERPVSSRRENERRNLSPFMPKGPLKIESPDMTLKGGRMDILQAIRYPPNTSQTMRSDQIGFHNFMRPIEGGYKSNDYFYQTYSHSQLSSPQNFGDVFQQDSNGVTVRYKKSMVKKKGNIVVRRPQSGIIKKNIEPHNPEQHLSINGLGSTKASSNSSGNLRNGFRFKF